MDKNALNKLTSKDVAEALAFAQQAIQDAGEIARRDRKSVV